MNRLDNSTGRDNNTGLDSNAGSAALVLLVVLIALIAGFGLAWVLIPRPTIDTFSLEGLQAELEAKQAEVEVLERLLDSTRQEIDSLGDRNIQLQEQIQTQPTADGRVRGGALLQCQEDFVSTQSELRSCRQQEDQLRRKLSGANRRLRKLEGTTAEALPVEGRPPVFLGEPKVRQGSDIEVTGVLHNTGDTIARGLIVVEILRDGEVVDQDSLFRQVAPRTKEPFRVLFANDRLRREVEARVKWRPRD